MDTQRKLIAKFNKPNVLGIVTSFPEKGGEIASDNAIARYSFLLVTNFPQNQKVVIFCEKRAGYGDPYLLGKNILVVPSYKVNSFAFFIDLISFVKKFSRVSNLLFQFEFSTFGGKIAIPGVLISVALAKIIGKRVIFMLHQVVGNLNNLDGHLGINRKSLKSKILNTLLKSFYIFLGAFCDKLLVHDAILAQKLSQFVSPAKIDIVPHGIGGGRSFSNKFKQISRRYFGIKDNEKVACIYGYRSWYKGTDWVIRVISRIIEKSKSQKIRLLVAGGESPTLKGTCAYKCFDGKLNKLIIKNKGNLVVTGFILEKDVSKVFAASDIVLFPYRARMSASGTFSLALKYKKPFIVSKAFSENLEEEDIKEAIDKLGIKREDIVFNLNARSFDKALMKILNDSTLKRKFYGLGKRVSNQRDWRIIASIYLGQFDFNTRYSIRKTIQETVLYAFK